MENTDWLQTGIAALREGDAVTAREHLRRAIDDRATRGTASYWLGVLLFRDEDMELAERYALDAVELEPGNAATHKLLGLIRHRQGNLKGAADSFRKELEILTPDFGTALANLGRTLHAMGDLEGAETALARAHAFVPTDQSLTYQLANVLHSRGRCREAAALYHQLLEHSPKSAVLWNDLGSAEAAIGEQGQAVDRFRHSLSLDSEQSSAHYNLGQALFSLGNVNDALLHFEQAIRLGYGADALTMAAVIVPGSRMVPQQILEIRKAFAQQCLPAHRDEYPRKAISAASPRPLRVGYLSAFFSDRNWMKPVWGLINRHDREQFEVHLFFDGERKEIVHGYEPHPTDRFHETGRLTNEELAATIEREEIDLLVDLNGYSRIPRLGLFPLHPAPVVAGWFNHFATTAIPGIDYLIGDDVVFPKEDEPHFTEQVLKVPGTYLTFDVNYPVPDVAPAPWLKTGVFTFGALCAQYKITPEMIGTWARILKESPESRLLLRNTALRSESNREYLRRAFSQEGVDADRILLEGPVEHYSFLETYARVDLALDTFPYNGGTTTTESIWQGVPVLTMRGDRWVARTSETLLRAAGLETFVVDRLSRYITRAIDLASHVGRETLAEVRPTLRDQVKNSKACDTLAFARNMESLYQQMVASARSLN
ncbi:MAG: tetratricopeptide repeat protein [Planctomycetota bacterium]